jgi:hypothetical protein
LSAPLAVPVDWIEPAASGSRRSSAGALIDHFASMVSRSLPSSVRRAPPNARRASLIWQGDVADGAAAALVDRRAHHRVEAVARDDEAALEGVDAVGERAAARHQPLDAGEDGIIFDQRSDLGRDAVQAARLVGEAQPLALDHAQASLRGGQLGDQEGEPARVGGIGKHADRRRARAQLRRRRGELLDRARIGVRRLAPFGRPVIGVDIAFLALADLEGQADIVAGERVERIGGVRQGAPGRGGGRRRRTAGDEKEQGGQQPFHHVHPGKLRRAC